MSCDPQSLRRIADIPSLGPAQMDRALPVEAEDRLSYPAPGTETGGGTVCPRYL